MLSYIDLFASLNYDPLTGVWTRIKSYTNRTKPGDRADRVSKRKQPHYTVAVLGKQYTAHRLAWFYMTGTWPENLVDHKDNDATNNCWSNLRLADKAQNAWNIPAHRDSSSGVKGVYWDGRRKRWIATIFTRGVKKHLGSFILLADAKLARQRAAERLHGEYARHA